MAATTDLTSEIKNADFSQGGADWTNEGSSSNFSSSLQIAIISTNSQRGISQTLGINYEEDKVYELSWKTGSTVGTHVQIKAGTTVIESALVSPRGGENTRVSYNFFVGAGSAYFVGQSITIRFAGNGVSSYSIDDIQLTMSDVKEYFDYGTGKKAMTTNATGGGDASRYDYLIQNRGSFVNAQGGAVEKKYHAHSNLSERATTMTYDSDTMYQELTLDPSKKYKVFFTVTTDHNKGTRKEEIKADNVVLVPEFTLKKDVIDYFSYDIPESEYINDGKVKITVINKIVNNLNGFMSELVLVEGEDIIVPKVQNLSATELKGQTSFTAKWDAVTPATTYKLYVSKDPNFGSYVQGTNGKNYQGLDVTNTTSYVVDGINDDDDLYYKVVAYYGASNHSVDSDPFKVEKNVITPAYGVEVAKVGAELKWSVDFEDTVASYNVEQHINGIWTKVTTVAAKGKPNSNYSVVVGDGEFRITAVDGSGFSQSFATESTKEVFINLTKGWNLISIPFEGADLTTLKQQGTLWTWNGTAYQEAKTVNALQGLWLFSESAKQLTLTGTKVANAQVNLSTGWNLVGPAENCKVPTRLKVFSWETTYQQILDASASLIQGHGYWMFADKKTTVKLGL